jgi:hypothetical protein
MSNASDSVSDLDVASESEQNLPQWSPPTPRVVDPPVQVREILVLLLIVALCDVTVYRAYGFAGPAVFMALFPLLFLLGCPRPSLRFAFWLTTGMLMLLALRMVWLGSVLGLVCGGALLVAVALATQGRSPYIGSIVSTAFGTLPSGYLGLTQYGKWASRLGPRTALNQWLGVLLPLAALALFGGLFVLANPDLVTWFVRVVKDLAEQVSRLLGHVPFHAREVVFWGLVAWLVVGLLRPGTRMSNRVDDANTIATSAQPVSSWYGPVRNTLVSVIVLFAVYLIFEFRTLWFREFPKGFYYAGYAHEGAAWLTTALAFATLTLSLMFRGDVLHNARIARLRTLAWIWSAENFLLALTVFHRLHIYIDFNGMTRMRMVALFGTSVVLIGFLLVVWKILRSHSFVWLVRNQLLALALTIYLFAVTPVDAIVHTYNVRHVLAGDLPPVVQITEHPINAEGILMLEPLMDCNDPIIREGIRAMLAEWVQTTERQVDINAALGWTTYQMADRVCLEHLQANRDRWKEYLDGTRRAEALARFRQYAYQWY